MDLQTDRIVSGYVAFHLQCSQLKSFTSSVVHHHHHLIPPQGLFNKATHIHNLSLALVRGMSPTVPQEPQQSQRCRGCREGGWQEGGHSHGDGPWPSPPPSPDSGQGAWTPSPGVETKGETHIHDFIMHTDIILQDKGNWVASVKHVSNCLKLTDKENWGLKLHNGSQAKDKKPLKILIGLQLHSNSQ